MAEYEQMEFDVRLESDRDLQENVNLAIDFACKQVQHERPKTIENRHEAYGILAEQYARVQKDISCKKIKIPSGGGIAFEVETDDPESPDSIKELEAVVIFTHRINSYWAESFGGSDNKAPDCSSFDSKKGVVFETGEIRDCDTCPYNEYGENGTGKPCKNMRRMYLLLSGKPGVYLLSVPPTSIKEVNNQLARLMGGSKIPYSRMVLKFKLTKDKNKNGIVYSKVGIERVGMLPQEYFKTTAAMRKELKEKYKEVVITSDDYTTAPADPVVDKEGFMDVDAAGDIPEELPFN